MGGHLWGVTRRGGGWRDGREAGVERGKGMAKALCGMLGERRGSGICHKDEEENLALGSLIGASEGWGRGLEKPETFRWHLQLSSPACRGQTGEAQTPAPGASPAVATAAAAQPADSGAATKRKKPTKKKLSTPTADATQRRYGAHAMHFGHMGPSGEAQRATQTTTNSLHPTCQGKTDKLLFVMVTFSIADDAVFLCEELLLETLPSERAGNMFHV